MKEFSREKSIDWIGSSLEDLKGFPKVVQQLFGFNLHRIQYGEMPDGTKPLKGVGVNGVYELKENYVGNTYRAVFIAKLRNKIYVLHCFQKKSNEGIKTPLRDIELVKKRLKIAIQDAKK